MSINRFTKFSEEKDQILIGGTCIITNEIYIVSVPYNAYAEWIGGLKTEEAFPRLSDSEKDFLNLGLTPKESEGLFNDGK